jgi:hypothetical protein
MGCDIHAFIERQMPDGSWTTQFKIDGITFDDYIERKIADGTAQTVTGTSDDDEARARFRAMLEAMDPDEAVAKLGDQIKPNFVMPEPFEWRHYAFFYAIAGVRGRGGPQFWEPRGVPPDVSVETADYIESWNADGHTHSWQMLSELLAEPGMKEFEAYYAAFEEIASKVDPTCTRLVYFFDN